MGQDHVGQGLEVPTGGMASATATHKQASKQVSFSVPYRYRGSNQDETVLRSESGAGVDEPEEPVT
jgi:hypothetical protein